MNYDPCVRIFRDALLRRDNHRTGGLGNAFGPSRRIVCLSLPGTKEAGERQSLDARTFESLAERRILVAETSLCLLY